MGSLFFSFLRSLYSMARDIKMNVFWHDFWSCAINKEDSIRYKWQKKQEMCFFDDGFRYLYNEKGKKITYPVRVITTDDLECCPQCAIARRAAKLKPIDAKPLECPRRDSKIQLPKINLPRCSTKCTRCSNKNCIRATLCFHPHKLRTLYRALYKTKNVLSMNLYKKDNNLLQI